MNKNWDPIIEHNYKKKKTPHDKNLKMQNDPQTTKQLELKKLQNSKQYK